MGGRFDYLTDEQMSDPELVRLLLQQEEEEKRQQMQPQVTQLKASGNPGNIPVMRDRRLGAGIPEQLPEENLGTAPVARDPGMQKYLQGMSNDPKPRNMTVLPEQTVTAGAPMEDDSQSLANLLPPEEPEPMAPPPEPSSPQSLLQPLPEEVQRERFNPQEAAQQAHQAFQQQPQQQPEPEMGYENRQSLGSAPSDSDLSRAWFVNTVFGNKGDNVAVANLQQNMRQAHDQNARQAYLSDQADYLRKLNGMPVDDATMQKLAQTGVAPGTAPPRRDSMAFKVQQSLGDVMGKENALMSKEDIATNRQRGDNYRSNNTLLGKQLGAQAKAADPDMKRKALISQLEDQLRLDPQTAEAIADGGPTSQFPPDKQRVIDQIKLQVDSMDARNIASLARGALSRDAGSEDQVDTKGRTAQIGQQHSEGVRKEQTGVMQTASIVADALDGWKALQKDPQAVQALISYGNGTLTGQARSAFVGKYGKYTQPIEDLVSVVRHEKFGSSLTQGEGRASASLFGISPDFNFFQDPSTLDTFIKRMSKGVKLRRDMLKKQGLWLQDGTNSGR